MESKKLANAEVLAALAVECELLGRLIIIESYSQRGDAADARIQTKLRNESDKFSFVVEAKPRSTPRALEDAIAQVKKLAEPEVFPLVLLPYLSAERLDQLEAAQVSGVDLCGNGVIIIPRRLYVLRTGKPNLYPDSRPLNNPFRGRSAMVARMLVAKPVWESLSALQAAIQSSGEELSLSQTSKAVSALQDDLLVSNQKGRIRLLDPLRLLDQLGVHWKNPANLARQSFRLAQGFSISEAFAKDSQLRWAIAGESAASRYVLFNQGGPQRIAVSRISLAAKLLSGKPEPIASFAGVELIETDEPGYYFANEVDTDGTRWANRVQTWLELQAGDGRQRAAARELRSQIVREIESR